jgi:tetratricopeptide (TPR) repeat protein
MPLRPNQSFNLTVAFTALVLLAEGALLWKLGHDQAQRTPSATPSTTPAPLVAATSPPLFAVPGLGNGKAPAPSTAAPRPGSPGGAAPGPGVPDPGAPNLAPPAEAARPPGAALPPEKRALAKTYFDAGSAALQQKDQKAALDNFLKVVEIAPDHLATRLNLAVLYLGARQPAAALPHLEKAVQIAPKNAATQFELGRTLVTLRRPQDAIAPLRASIQLAPKESASRQLLAQIYLAQKKPLDAYRQWTALAQAQPNDVEAHLQAAGLAADVLKRPAEAEKWLRLAANGTPRDPRPALLLGRFLLGRKKSKEAVQILGKAAKARPDVFEIYPLLADARLASGDLSGALGALESALLRLPIPKTDAEKKEVARLEGSLRFSLGRIYGQSKKPKQALGEFRRAAEMAPGDPEIQSMIGLAAVQSGDNKGAIAALNAALKLDPKRATDHRLLAQLLARDGNWTGANQHYETYNQLQPRDGSALIEWADMARRAKKTDQELRIWGKLAAADPKNPFPLMQSAVVLREAKRPAEALAKFERALALNPKDSNILYEIARLQTQLKRSGDATATWKKVIVARPDFVPAYASLLVSSAKSGDDSSTRLFLARRLAQDKDPKVLGEVLRYYQVNKKSAEARALLSDVVKRNPKARAAKAALDSYSPVPEPEVAKPTAPAKPAAPAKPTDVPEPTATP